MVSRCFIFLGPPGSGKGTQGQLFAEKHQLAYINMGAILRDEIQSGSVFGEKIDAILKKSEYLPDSWILPILEKELTKYKHGCVLDGVPRTIEQARFLDHWLAQHQYDLQAVILLKVRLDTLLERVRSRVECRSCHWTGSINQTKKDGKCPKCDASTSRRDDDDDLKFLKRYEVYLDKTLPVITHYRLQEKLFTIDAMHESTEVQAMIEKKLATFISVASERLD